jgi:hypothetical protein
MHLVKWLVMSILWLRTSEVLDYASERCTTLSPLPYPIGRSENPLFAESKSGFRRFLPFRFANYAFRALQKKTEYWGM